MYERKRAQHSRWKNGKETSVNVTSMHFEEWLVQRAYMQQLGLSVLAHVYRVVAIKLQLKNLCILMSDLSAAVVQQYNTQSISALTSLTSVDKPLGTHMLLWMGWMLFIQLRQPPLSWLDLNHIRQPSSPPAATPLATVCICSQVKAVSKSGLNPVKDIHFLPT